VFVPEEDSPLAAPFYVMERVPGLILRNRPPPGLALTPERMRGLSEAFVDQLAALHALDLDASGLRAFGKPEGYLSRQVRGWTERYARAKTDEIPELEAMAAWLARELPPEAEPALIHNDFKYDNLVLDPESLAIRAVLDWEMATVGDPLSDLGMALAYWIQADDPKGLRALDLGLTGLPGNLTRAELVRRYAQVTGRDTRHVGWHYVLSLFKVAVIAQQIYARFHQGLTHDERFGALIGAVRTLGWFGAQTIDRGTPEFQ
jgi:aminoglycoside phosphotransferase (APT) family kinase protein